MNPVSSPKDKVVEVREISFSGIMSEADQDLVTGVSRVTRWREERAGRFPRRVRLSAGRQGRHGHEIKKWIENRPFVDVESRIEEAMAAGTTPEGCGLAGRRRFGF